jgi:hypothetical protein
MVIKCITGTVLLSASTVLAAGDTFWLGSSSSMNVSFDFTTLTGGTLIGDFEAEGNPGGTKTMPGVWGSEGNEPIPLSLDQELSGGGTTAPSGSFSVSVDTSIGLIGIENLNIDVLGGESLDELPVSSTIYMLFDTFRTYNPSSLFVGGFELPIPLGSGAVTAWSFQQSGIAGGVLVETETPGEWTFAAVATVDVMLEANLEGQPIEIPATPIALPLVGTYTETATQQIIVITLDQSVDETQVLDPPIDLPATPLPLPTIVPPGSTANVVLSLSLTEIASVLTQSGMIYAARDVEQAVPGDATGDGHVNVDDLLVVISQWGPCSDCAADFNEDGMVGVDDLLALLANWGI